MTEDKRTAGLAALIPELFHDFIARIPPGVLLFAVALSAHGWLAFDGPLDPRELLEAGAGASVLLFILLLGIGYSLGVPLNYLGRKCEAFYRSQAWKAVAAEYADELSVVLRAVHTNWGLSFPEATALKESDFTRLYTGIHDYLKQSDAYARPLLTKLQAEALLCPTLAVTSILSFAYWVGVSWFLGVALVWRGVLVSALIIGTAAWVLLLAGRYRYKRLIVRHLGMFLASLVPTEVTVSNDAINSEGSLATQSHGSVDAPKTQ